MNMPETLWKSYIDSEITLEEYDNTRNLYGRLLNKTKHIKVWVSYAQFEKSIGNVDNARKILQEAEDYFKNNFELKEERVLLL